ncbi:hypothetical protein HZ326_10927 [Fusarium oxysporum f. sp. albedinis]|nr:hypothetical protein HZ326_10927 [Fusarium oxysporum f. sp. albedinis]
MPFSQTSLFYDLDNASRHWLVGPKVTSTSILTLNPQPACRPSGCSCQPQSLRMPSFENSSSAASHMQQFILPYNRHKPSRNHLPGTPGPLNLTSSLLRCQEKLAFPLWGLACRSDSQL